MADWDWQLLAALVCVAWAAVALARRALRLAQSGAKTGCAGSCHASREAPERGGALPIVPLAGPGPPASPDAPAAQRG